MTSSSARYFHMSKLRKMGLISASILWLANCCCIAGLFAWDGIKAFRERDWPQVGLDGGGIVVVALIWLAGAWRFDWRDESD